VIRKGRSASAPPAPTEAGRPRDPRAPGGPLEPFEQVGVPPFNSAFDEFESSFGAFESADDASSADRFERTSESRKQRAPTARAGGAPAASQRPGPSLKGRALGYLSRREYSRAELSRKLMPYTDNADELEALLDSLVREGWLSDARFAESIIHRRAARLGATRIVGELKRHAVGDTLIEEVSAQLRETELARARAVWQKKYGKLPEAPAERARQARFLAARGFSMAIIGKILKGIEDDWSEN
jgi:regulatory protein